MGGSPEEMDVYIWLIPSQAMIELTQYCKMACSNDKKMKDGFLNH